jgi:hypothetical protein
MTRTRPFDSVIRPADPFPPPWPRAVADVRRPSYGPRNRAHARSPCRLAATLSQDPEAARFLSLSGRTLEKHRIYGTGPQYRKIGGRVVYALDDLQAWANLGAKNSTSDPGVGTVLPAKRQTAPVAYAGKERR